VAKNHRCSAVLITWSARASTNGSTLIPRARAVLRFKTSRERGGKEVRRPSFGLPRRNPIEIERAQISILARSPKGLQQQWLFYFRFSADYSGRPWG
jgi:hypothetical protein